MDTGVQKIYRLDDQPFAQIPRQAIRDRRITQNGFRLLAYLMSHAHGYELTYGQIERETGLGRWAINGAIDNLQELGWLEVSRTKLQNGQFGPYAWYITNPTSTTVGYSTVEQPHMGEPTDNKNKKEQENKTIKKYPQAKLEEMFESFWEQYPRKVEKIAAKRAFEKVLDEYGEAVLEGVAAMAQDPNLPPKQFIPYPATWLNAGGWENEPYPERQLTKDELEAKQKAEREVRAAREREKREAEQRAREIERAKGEEARSTVKRCEHDRVAVICSKCNRATRQAKKTN
jgi:hypothetical protein